MNCFWMKKAQTLPIQFNRWIIQTNILFIVMIDRDWAHLGANLIELLSVEKLISIFIFKQRTHTKFIIIMNLTRNETRKVTKR